MSIALSKYGKDKQIPNSLAGRKMKAFLEEVDNFYNWWDSEKAKIDKKVRRLSGDEQYKLAVKYLSYIYYKDGRHVSDEDMAIEIENSASKYREKYNEYEIESQYLSFREARNMTIEQYAKYYLYVVEAKEKINKVFYPNLDEKRNMGYCAASIMECLRRSDKNSDLETIFMTDWENLLHPTSLFKHISEMQGGKYSKHLYKCSEKYGSTVQEIISKNNIKPGALVCLTFDKQKDVDLDGYHNHLVLYTGMNKYGQQYFTSFDEDMSDGMINTYNKGYVLDMYSVAGNMINEKNWGKKLGDNVKDCVINDRKYSVLER